jgi:hypothetical protein
MSNTEGGKQRGSYEKGVFRCSEDGRLWNKVLGLLAGSWTVRFYLSASSSTETRTITTYTWNKFALFFFRGCFLGMPSRGRIVTLSFYCDCSRSLKV